MTDENGNGVGISFRLNPKLYTMLKNVAEEDCCAISAVIRKACVLYVRQRGREI